MAKVPGVNISEMFNTPLPDTHQRLEMSYQDPVVQGWARAYAYAPAEARPALEAQINSYLAAAYALFPEESQVIHSSLEPKDGDV